MTSPARPARRRPDTATLLVLAIVLASVAVRLPLLGGPQIDYDEGVYWESLRSMASGHPLYSAVYSSQPPGFLPLMAGFFGLGHSLVAARAGVLVFFAVAVLATYVVARSIAGERAGVAAAALLAVDPLMLRQSVTLQADGPAVAMGMVALACAYASARATTRRAALLAVAAGAALALAVLVKLLAVAVVVPVVLVLLLQRGRLARLAWTAAGAAMAAAVVLLPFADRLHLVWSQSVGSHLTARSLHEGGLTGDMAHALAFESPFYAAALAGIVVLLWRAPRTGAVVLAWGAAIATLALTQKPLWPHHLLIASPMVALAAAAPAGVPWRRVSPRAVTAIAASGVVALSAAGMATGLRAIDHAFTADTHADAVAVLRQAARPHALVVTDDQFAAAAADLDTPPELVDTSYVRLDSSGVTAADVERIIDRDGVRVVYIGTERLVHLAGLRDWVRSHFPRAIEVSTGGTVYSEAP